MGFLSHSVHTPTCERVSCKNLLDFSLQEAMSNAEATSESFSLAVSSEVGHTASCTSCGWKGGG